VGNLLGPEVAAELKPRDSEGQLISAKSYSAQSVDNPRANGKHAGDQSRDQRNYEYHRRPVLHFGNPFDGEALKITG
jgi:hypothetical protein